MPNVEATPVDDGVDAEQRLLEALFSPEGRRDPHPLFRSVSLPGCRYAVAERMLRDATFTAPLLKPSEQPLWQMFARWLINLDGERHVRIRRLFAGLFTPRRVEAFRKVVAERADALVDHVVGRRRMDLVVEFARPLPFSVIVQILGVPEERRSWIAERMFTLGQGFAHQQEPEFVERAGTAVLEMLEYYSDLLEQRTAEPRDDLISALAASRPADAEGRRDLLANCVFFVEAGHVTTTSLISAGTLLLLEHPDRHAHVLADSGAIVGAVEEMLRLISPVTAVICRAREDAEIDGFRFPAGAHRRVLVAAANRDPAAFPDPDRFDIARTPNRHLAFSAGAHFCLGAPLARLHGEIAISTLLRRLPNLRLDGEPVWRGSLPLRELEHLPVAWDSSDDSNTTPSIG
jgi:pimeloyl-[acyl-carrier protein] synthase